MEGKGRVLFATRDIRALDLVLIDPGTVVGPNYRSKKVCLECLKLLGMAAMKSWAATSQSWASRQH